MMIVQMLILRMMLNVIVGSLYDVILCVRLFGSLQRGASQVFFPPEVLFIFLRLCIGTQATVTEFVGVSL